jgi:hypothetical protein
VSCGNRTRPVNPERPGEHGRWVMPRPPSKSATGRLHRWQYRNTLGIVGGPVVQECLGCGESHWPTWVPDVAVRPTLPAAAPFIVGTAEWVDTPRTEWPGIWQDPPLIRDAADRQERGAA